MSLNLSNMIVKGWRTTGSRCAAGSGEPRRSAAKRLASRVLPLALSIAALNAAPRLQLLPPSSFAAIPVAVGSNGPNVSVDTKNLGSGTLQLQVSSAVPWLVPTVGTVHTCGFSQCTPVKMALQTAALAKGSYTGVVTVTDPNALDAPQNISVTVDVGGNIPDQQQFYLAPGGSTTASFTAASKIHTNVTTQSGGKWLSVSAGAPSLVAFPYTITASAAGLAVGDYQGAIAVTGSSLAADNKTIQVTLHVTADPILLTTPELTFLLAQNAVKQTAGVGISNGGGGTLTVSSVTATSSGANWLSAQTVQGGLSVTADPTGLAPGTYAGTLTIASNAANGSVVVQVTLNVEAQGPPFAAAGGVVNNGNFAGGESLAQGDIVALFGDQFTFSEAQQAMVLPLTNDLGGTEVLVNDQPVPLYYVSAGQINFQIPYEARLGDGTVSVMRNGTVGNKVFVNIMARVPRLISLNGGPYAIIATPQAQLTGIPGAPVHIGDTVVIYALGMGPTTPPVASGVASPTNPLSKLPPGTQVCIGDGTPFTPPAICTGTLYAGLTPGLVGLYQINVTIPKNVPKGDDVSLIIQVADTVTNRVPIAIR